MNLSIPKEQKISFLYKNRLKSQCLSISVKPDQTPCGIFGNFLIFFSSKRRRPETRQLNFLPIFETIMDQKELEAGEEFILRFLGGSKNRESRSSLRHSLTLVFRNCFQELAVTQLNRKRHSQALESFALSRNPQINMLLESDSLPFNFELYWLLLGFSDSFIPILLNNKLTRQALETLVLLGDTEQAINLIRSSKKGAAQYSAELERISEVCLEQRDTDAFLQVQTLLGNKEKEVDYFIRHRMAAELSEFVRPNHFGDADRPLLQRALAFFEAAGHPRAAWDVLLKLKDRRLMVKFAIRNKNFVDALKLLKESKEFLGCPELALPLAEYLVYKHKLREAFDLFRRVGQEARFESTMQSYTKLQFLKGDHAKLARAFRFLFRVCPKPLYLRFLKFFNVLTHVQGEVEKIKGVRARAPDPTWEQVYFEHLTRERVTLKGTQFSRLSVLESQLAFLLTFPDLLENPIFRGIKGQVKRISGTISDLKGSPDFFTKTSQDLTSPGEKENFDFNLGSKNSFKKQAKKGNTGRSFSCFLCNTAIKSRKSDSPEQNCPHCGVPLKFCSFSGVPIPVVPFQIGSPEGKRVAN